MEKDVRKTGRCFFDVMNDFERFQYEQDVWWVNQMIEDDAEKIVLKSCLVKCGKVFLYYHPDEE